MNYKIMEPTSNNVSEDLNNYVPVKSSRLRGRNVGPSRFHSYGALIVFSFAIGLVFVFFLFRNLIQGPSIDDTPAGNTVAKLEFEQFTTKKSFIDYLEDASEAKVSLSSPFVGDALSRNELSLSPSSLGSLPELGFTRYSETNVQVAGLDEPDIVKTNGKEIFFSPPFSRYTTNVINPITPSFEVGTKSSTQLRIPNPVTPTPVSGTRVLSVLAAGEVSETSSIVERGDLLLHDNTLVVFSGRQILGYDVSNPNNPNKKWSMDLSTGTNVVTSRLQGGKLFAITKSSLKSSSPCPVSVLRRGLSVSCGDIWHPTNPIDVDSIYSILQIDIVSGELLDSVTFVASSNRSVVYVSPESVYVTYPFTESVPEFVIQAFTEIGTGVMPTSVITRLNEIGEYEISDASKIKEMEIAIDEYSQNLDRKDRSNLENKMEKNAEGYVKKHIRDLEKTGIVKISLETFEISNTGVVPGSVLNQFSLDEYKGNLRIATNSSGRLPFIGSLSESFNDIFVLDENLDTVGKILDLGITEKIYSTRFVGDKGYLVTFRRIDPFYVLDLSDPQNPKLAGELKIPGFSSYLHPLSPDIILGIGEENQNTNRFVLEDQFVAEEIIQPTFLGPQVKISLFDVSDPENPREVDKYLLEESWSEISQSHHAFLRDDLFDIFFVPAGTSGYIFSHKGNELELVKKVSDINARRALFIDSYLYVLGDSKMVVLDENTWREVSELTY